MVIFNPAEVADQATYEDPHQYPKGLPYVAVNGVLVIDNGEHTHAKAGKALRNQNASAEPLSQN